MDYLVDTCFLIDLWREQHAPGSATALARSLDDKSFGINWVAAGEFLAGGRQAGHSPELLSNLLQRFRAVTSDHETISAYADLFVMCRKAKRSISSPDLWIAACARRHAAPLITRNVRDFEGLEGVSVVAYAAP